MDQRYVDMAGRIGLGHSARIAGLFEIICDSTEADILLATPGQAATIAEKLGLSEDEVQQKIDTLFVKGVAFPSSKTDPPTWRMCRDLVQFHDASILWPEAPQAFLDAWRDFMNNEWFDLAKVISKQVDKPFTRIIPVGVSIEARTQILGPDSVREAVENAHNLAVTKCTCRMTMGNCDRPQEVCLQVNRAADYTLARGTGRKVSAEEALDILRKCEEEGLIHVTMNRSSMDHFICNCCPCCCQTMPVLIKGGVHVVDPSRFVAAIDQDACSGCGLCHERCYFSAIEFSDGEGSPSLVLAEKCMGCGLCAVTCPEDAITLDETRPKEFVPGG